MRILVDTGVLIDVALDRAPHAAAAGEMLDRIERGEAAGFVAWHSASDFHYLVAPKRGQRDARTFPLEMLDFVEVAPSSADVLRRAVRLDLRDFEDAMQVAAALACGADVIATRNVRDYAKAPIAVATPVSIVRSLAGG